jgi:transcriptional antiterminator
MFGKLQYSNHIGVDQKTMSEELGVTTRTIAQSIKELTEAKILIVYNDIQDKRRNVYIINPHQAWKGTFKERTKKMAQLNLNQTKLIL